MRPTGDKSRVHSDRGRLGAIEPSESSAAARTPVSEVTKMPKSTNTTVTSRLGLDSKSCGSRASTEGEDSGEWPAQVTRHTHSGRGRRAGSGHPGGRRRSAGGVERHLKRRRQPIEKGSQCSRLLHRAEEKPRSALKRSSEDLRREPARMSQRRGVWARVRRQCGTHTPRESSASKSPRRGQDPCGAPACGLTRPNRVQVISSVDPLTPQRTIAVKTSPPKKAVTSGPDWTTRAYTV